MRAVGNLAASITVAAFPSKLSWRRLTPNTAKERVLPLQWSPTESTVAWIGARSAATVGQTAAPGASRRW
jgi:hypothetical protein